MDDERIFRLKEGDTARVERDGYSKGCWGKVAGITLKGPIMVFASSISPGRYRYEEAILVEWDEIYEM